MRILLVHNDYGGFSGEEAAVNNTAQVLESHGHEITWFRRSSAVIGNSLKRKTRALFSGIYSFDSRKKIGDLLDGKDFDLVQVQNLYPFISPSIFLACRERQVPVVMRCPNYRLFCPNGLHLSHGKMCERCLGGKEWHCVLQNCESDVFKSFGYAARNAFARKTGMIQDNVAVFIVLSEFQKRRFMDGGIPAEKMAILPNIAFTTELPLTESVGETVTYVGRVSEEKGVRVFVEAARRLPGLQFLVTGDNDAMPGLQAEAPSNVDFTGFQSGKALDNIFNNSRVLVSPNTCFEGFPNVIVKAMAHAKPVVASRIGGIPEIVDDGVTGLLVEPGNDVDLAKKIEYLWNRTDTCREMGVAGLRKAKSEYSEERFYERLMAIYQRALRPA